ncbi:MAG: response regulator transcription factor [Proteobacteria bacterium]|jgi:DNA-binding response OmpR family regulator|nr:response regulator transcription factor [Pseudomonadota bacterium]
MRLLLIEDDVPIANALVEGFARAGISVDHLVRADTAESALELTAYDLLIVDLELPGMNGLELIRRLRRAQVALPVLILTARDALEDRVQGLDTGADDYLVKPFLFPELLARVRALVRRSQAVGSSDLVFGPLRLYLNLRTASLCDAPLELTGREWDVLQHLMLAAPRVVSKQKLAESLGNWDSEISPNAIEIYVSRLRNKLSESGATIRTVRGIGYRLEWP